MLEANIVRFHTDNQGTSGILRAFDFSCYVLELPWHDNISQFSCIPEGEYVAKLTFSPHMHKFTYELSGVPHRGQIRIHGGNFAGDTRLGYKSHVLGCFLLGRKIITPNGGQRMITTSGPTVSEFERVMHKKPFTLNVSWLK